MKTSLDGMAMVLQAYDLGEGLGGHIATYASTTMTGALNHFIRSRSDDYQGDMFSIQAHSSPRVQSILEGRLSVEEIGNFRELQKDGGLPSYPHQGGGQSYGYPTASMGLNGVCSIYYTRFSNTWKTEDY